MNLEQNKLIILTPTLAIKRQQKLLSNKIVISIRKILRIDDYGGGKIEKPELLTERFPESGKVWNKDPETQTRHLKPWNGPMVTQTYKIIIKTS